MRYAIPEERLVRLIEHFSQKNLSNDNVSPDILGDGYEYLLKKFNEVAPKRAGELKIVYCFDRWGKGEKERFFIIKIRSILPTYN